MDLLFSWPVKMRHMICFNLNTSRKQEVNVAFSQEAEQEADREGGDSQVDGTTSGKT